MFCRPEDDEVLERLLAGDYVNVLTSRQMGKSSLMAQTAFALREQGVRVVLIDLAGELGSPLDAATYYKALSPYPVKACSCNVLFGMIAFS